MAKTTKSTTPKTQKGRGGETHQQASGAGNQAALDFGNAEMSVIGGDDQVTTQRHFTTASNCVALDGSNQRFLLQFLAESSKATPLYHWNLACNESLEVHAGAENSTSAGNDRNLDFTVTVQSVQ